MNRPTVGVYTPVKNEVRHVERWAETARQADYLFMLDTGSDDETVKLAESCGIEVAEAHISPFRFDDARNIALSLIPAHIDIVLQLDADELLVDGWRQAVDGVDPAHNRWSYWLRPHKQNAGWGAVRRSNMHRRHGFRWEHPVHEIVVGPPADAHLDDVVVLHHPDISKPRGYLAMMQEFHEKLPQDSRLLFYLAREYVTSGDWVSARTHLVKFLEHPNAKAQAGERSEAYLMLGNIDDNPPRWYLQAVVECPQRREPFVFLAKDALKRGEYADAAVWIRAAEKRTDESVYTTRRECWGKEFEGLKRKIMRKAAL